MNFLIILLFLRIIYRYDYWIGLAGSKELLHDIIGFIFVWWCTIDVFVLIFPRWMDFIHKRQIIIKLGDIDPHLYLNYHPEDSGMKKYVSLE